MIAMSAHRSVTGVRAALAAGLAVVALLATGCSASGLSSSATPPAGGPTALTQNSRAPTASAATQTSEGGQVTVAVTWQANQDRPVFKVALDTHSVDLDAVDLSQTAVLRTDQGVEVRPSGWDAPRGGHHRSGSLIFPPTTPDGAPVFGAGTRSVELLIRDIAGVSERRFQWTL